MEINEMEIVCPNETADIKTISDTELQNRADKPIISVEFLGTVGITESCLDKATITLEKISKLIISGKCEWTNDKTTPSKLNRLKWAAKKLISGISYGNKEIKVNERKRKRYTEKSRELIISQRTGISRLRKDKEIRMGQIFKKTERNGRVMNSEIIEKQNKIEDLPLTSSLLTGNNIVDLKFYPMPKKCYICKINFTKVHTFYDQLCSKCSDFCYSKRIQSADLTGKVALVTGGRIKIGYEVVLKLLRCGISRVITTTRFPQDAAKRYAHEYDFEIWKNRLDIYGLDLRFLNSVEKFCKHISITYPQFDILIQNAAQTIRRPPAFYSHLISNETLIINSPLVKNFENNLSITVSSSNSLLTNNPLDCIPSLLSTQINFNQFSTSALTSQLNIHPEDNNEQNNILFPIGQFDCDHQQIDLRPTNSWVLETPEIDTTELVEVSIVNSISPFIILSKLTPLLKKSTLDSDSTNENNIKKKYGWIILVSAMEGQFYRIKSTQHPHTNCAKAALNMLVRTSSSYYAKFNLLMNAIDTGWVTDEVPFVLRKENKHKKIFIPPLDEIDGAARILDPIFQTINHGIIEYGNFYKDYKQTLW